MKIFLAFAFISDIIDWLPKNRERGGRKSEDLKVMRVNVRKIAGMILVPAILFTSFATFKADVYAGGPGYIPGVKKSGPEEAPYGSTVVGPGGYAERDGKSYNKVKFLYHHPIYKSYTEDTDSVVYYSDGFFDTSTDEFNPKNYNKHIASASMALAFSGMYLRTNEEADANGNIYYNKHAGVRQFFADMGCPDDSIYVNESNISKPQTDSIGVAISSKELEYADGTKTERILIPVVVRGGGYEQEWASNMTLGHAGDVEGKEAKGFSDSATIVMDEIRNYISSYGLQGKLDEGKITFWVTGYSRAGAVANIVSKRLIEDYIGNDVTDGNEVISYPCEAPKGGTDDAEKLSNKTAYFRIHNIVNPGDIVPLMAPEEMGFKRYGVDHYIPGYGELQYNYILSNKGYTETKKVEKGGNGGPASVTTYADNRPSYIKDVSADDKASMRAQLKTLDPEITIDDSFQPMSLDIFTFETKASGKSDGNHIEEFIKDFVYFLQWGNMPGNSNYDWSQAIKNRDYYADELEPFMRDMIAAVYTMSEAEYSVLMQSAKSAKYDVPELPIMPMYQSEMPYLPGVPKRVDKSCGLTKAGLYFDVICRWGHLSQSDRDEYVSKTWDLIVQEGVLDHFDSYTQESLKKNWPKVINFAFTYIVADYNYFPGGLKKAVENPPTKWANACIPNEFGVCMPDYFYEPQVDTVTTMQEPNERSLGWANGANDSMMFTGTYMTYADYITKQHYPEVNLAWLRINDTYYYNDTFCDGFNYEGYEVSAPTATISDAEVADAEVADAEVADAEVADTEAEIVTGEKQIKLSVDDTVGEAIYYDIMDADGNVLAANKLYMGGIRLSPESFPDGSYVITAYAISRGVRSEKMEFTFSVGEEKTDEEADDETDKEKEATLTDAESE